MKLLAYIWTGPTTLIGLPLALLAPLTGGSVAIHTGVLEAQGGVVRFLLRHCTLLKGGASAMTLGHIVIAQDPRALQQSRAHERVHVRQCQRWGPFFIPAYLAASLLVWVRGGDAYRENPFEIEAYNHDAATHGSGTG